MKIGQPKLSEREIQRTRLFAPIDVDPGVIPEVEDYDLKVNTISLEQAQCFAGRKRSGRRVGAGGGFPKLIGVIAR